METRPRVPPGYGHIMVLVGSASGSCVHRSVLLVNGVCQRLGQSTGKFIHDLKFVRQIILLILLI